MFWLANPESCFWRKTYYKGLSRVVGLPGFEPGSIAPEATSLDQTSRQPQVLLLVLMFNITLAFKLTVEAKKVFDN